MVALIAAHLNEALSRVTHRPPRAPLAGVRMAKHKMYFNPTKAMRELGLPQTPPQKALADAYDPRAEFSPTINLKEPWKQATGVVIPRNSTLTERKTVQEFCGRAKRLRLHYEQ